MERPERDDGPSESEGTDQPVLGLYCTVMPLARSGLQKDVLKLYRRALRMVNSKPETTRPKFRLFVRYTFHDNASKVSPRNVSFIEHLLRKGARQIESYEDPGVKDCWVSEEMIQWNEAWKKGPKRTLTDP